MFQRAKRRRAWIKIAITGPSGSGKTYSALKLGFGLGQRVALVDTENGSASLYDELGAFDVLEIGPPFTVAKYLSAIHDAAREGYDVMIVDSLSHAWAGEGGLLAKKEVLDQRGGNKFSNWAGITKEHEQLKAALVQSPIHLIATIRSKTEYVVGDEKGNSAPRKVGLAPVQREGIEYEFSTVFDLGMDHSATVTKDRTGLFDGMAERLTLQHGRRILEWLATGGEPRAADPDGNGQPPAAAVESATPYANAVMKPTGPPPQVAKSASRQKAEEHTRKRIARAELAGITIGEMDWDATSDDDLRAFYEALGRDIERVEAAKKARDAEEAEPAGEALASEPEAGFASALGH